MLKSLHFFQPIVPEMSQDSEETNADDVTPARGAMDGVKSGQQAVDNVTSQQQAVGDKRSEQQAAEDVRCEPEAGAAGIVDECRSSWIVGQLREGDGILCGAVTKIFEVSSEQSQLASEEGAPEAATKRPHSEELSPELVIGIMESQKRTSADGEKSAAEVDTEGEDIVNKESMLSTTENAIAEKNSVSASLPMNSESSDEVRLRF